MRWCRWPRFRRAFAALDARLDGRSGREPFAVADLLLAVRGGEFVELLLVAVERVDHAGDRGVVGGASPHRRSEARRVESVDDRGGDEGVHLVGKDERAAASVAARIARAHVAAATVAARARDHGGAAVAATEQPSEQVLARHPVGAPLGVVEQSADARGLRGLDDGWPRRRADDLAVVLALPADARAVQELADAVAWSTHAG